MATEYPPLNKIYVFGYSANDRDFPILSATADPRVAGYRVPEDLSACPDKRYPNHVFTGAQPISGDQRVRHVWEILPSPWVPFTRYDDDLGPVQGRRRSVKNEGQVAIRQADKQVTYEAREGSAIVYTELEETWSIATDEDGNSLFPIRDRDFYDPSRGPVQERRQLFVPTGEEEGSLENVNGVITQTSYEPYNDFLSVKIVQTYRVDGPQLIGKATNNEGQLTTVTTQRKAAKDYVAPNPTATRTVEANREDAESIIERVIDTPEVFAAPVYRRTREDLTPQKFKAAQSDTTFEQTIEGTASAPTLGTGEFVKSEEQINKFLKRVSTTSRVIASASILNELVLTNEGQVGTRKLTLASGAQTFTPSATMVDASVEALGDGRTVKTEVTVPKVFSGKTITKTKTDLTPEKFKAKQEDTTTEESVAGTVSESLSLVGLEFRKSEQQVTEFIKRVSTTTRDTTASVDLEEFILTPQGQLAKRTLRLSSQPQTINPDATFVDASIEELGDGRTIKTEVRVPYVFDGLNLTASKPDVIPPAFRASVPSQTTQETIEADNAAMPVLEENDLEASEQRITEFTVRKTKTTRDTESLPTLAGQEYEPNTNIVVQYEESIEAAGTKLGNVATSIDPLSKDFDLVREYDLDQIGEQLSEIFLEFPTRASLSLPPVLKNITLEFEPTKENGVFTNTLTASVNLGNNSNSQSGSADASASVKPVFSVEMENVYASNLPTTSYIFFLKYPVTMQDILNRVDAKQWPVFKPKSHVITATGETKKIATSGSYSKSTSVLDKTGNVTTLATQQGSGSGYSAGSSIFSTVLQIEPCLHGTIDLRKTASETANATLNFIGPLGVSRSDNVTAKGKCVELLGPTYPPDIPRSERYLIDSRVDLYQYGYARVFAEVLDAEVFAEI